MPYLSALEVCLRRGAIQIHVFIFTSSVAPNSPDLNPVDNSMWKILQKNVYKTHITDLELSMTPLTNGCCNDYVIQLGPLCSQSLSQFVQTSYAHFIQLLFNSLHTIYCNQLDSNLANLEATVKVGSILEFLCVPTSW